MTRSTRFLVLGTALAAHATLYSPSRGGGEGGDGAAATADAQGEQAADGKTKRAKTSAMIPLTLPLDLHALITEKAKEANKSAADFSRTVLAEYVKYDKPIVMRSRTKKYATKEEREKAQKEKYEKARALMLAFEAGELPPEVVARFEAIVKAEREAKAAQEAAAKSAEAQPEAAAASA